MEETTHCCLKSHGPNTRPHPNIFALTPCHTRKETSLGEFKWIRNTTCSESSLKPHKELCAPSFTTIHTEHSPQRTRLLSHPSYSTKDFAADPWVTTTRVWLHTDPLDLAERPLRTLAAVELAEAADLGFAEPHLHQVRVVDVAQLADPSHLQK